MTTNNITRALVSEDRRIDVTAELFGVHFPMRLEPTIYAMTDRLAEEYQGGYWEFYTLSNGGWFMAPSADTPYRVSCENGYQGEVSAEAFGIACCLYAYSHLSFGGGAFAEVCGNHFHLLRALALDHSEAEAILRVID